MLRWQQQLNGALGKQWDEQQLADCLVETMACIGLSRFLDGGGLQQSGAAQWIVAQADPLWSGLAATCFLPPEHAARHSQDLWCRLGVPELVAEMVASCQAEPAGPECSGHRSDRASRDSDLFLYAYELFLRHYDAERRTRHGVYMTPRGVARFIVRQVDHVLRDEFGLCDGLAAAVTWGEQTHRLGRGSVCPLPWRDLPFVTIADPAMGTGVFLVEVIDRIHQTFLEKRRSEPVGVAGLRDAWDAYVTQHMLPRLHGFELMLPAFLAARINLARKLAQTGYRFEDARPWPGGMLADTLAGPGPCVDEVPVGSAPSASGWPWQRPFTVIVGNPPFAAISDNHSPWIRSLLRGDGDHKAAGRSYYEVDGQPLRERKIWFHDDYVKFIRHAQWRIDASGCGVVGFVTNHGYLDNASFRGMRYQLMQTFPRITVLDLHGNRKKCERAPGGAADENVFDIETGVAISLFRRPLVTGLPPQVLHAQLWGSRKEKLERLSCAHFQKSDGSEVDGDAQASTSGSLPSPQQLPQRAPRRSPSPTTLAASPLTPRPPFYLFRPGDRSVLREFERGYKLTDVMPVNTTAVVTARDRFVVAFDRRELLRRMRQFRDLKVTDEEIRRRYFGNTRSRKYPSGDTRGWKLSDARRRMADDEHWNEHVRWCLYRPFDRRVIYWTDWMIDWPRRQVMRHLDGRENLALITRRQMLASRPCDYFWICDHIPVDGVIRSDNRGSESVFPLYLYDGPDGQRRTANFDERFVNDIAGSLKLDWVAEGATDRTTAFGPDDLACYTYALFHAPSYRQRFAEGLRTDFPRLFLPAEAALFRALVRRGRQLVQWHLDQPRPAKGDHAAARFPFHGPHAEVQNGYPKYSAGRIYVNRQACFSGLTRPMWDYHVGGYQVCRKWLKDRVGRNLSPAEIGHYQWMLVCLARTRQVLPAIDREIQRRGAWPQAFRLA